MDLKPYLGPALLAALIVCAASSLLAQSAPAATQGNIPLSVGVGLSGYNQDINRGHLLGGTVWIDYTLPYMPHILHGIGMEAEARDLNYARSASIPPGVREDVVLGGVSYSWPRYRRLRPYAKFMMGYGNADGENTTTTPVTHYHDSRTITSTGGGINYRVFRNIWARVDYEYQFWPNYWKRYPTDQHGANLTPTGFTVGAMYHFNHRH
jgi:opacity protein-like surface antigen